MEVLVSKANSYAELCYFDYELSKEKPFVLAVSSILCMLDRLKIEDFREPWLKKVKSYFEIEIEIEKI